MDQYSSGRKFNLSGWYIVLLLLICVVGLFAAFIVTGKNNLKKEIAAIRAAGYPTNYEELDKYYSIPEGVPNAADLYTKAFEAYQKPSGELADHLPMRGSEYREEPRSPLNSNNVEAIIFDLQANKETLELLGKAAAIKHCRYDLDFSQGGILYIPNLTEMKGCAQLLAEQTMLLAHQDDGDAAVKNIARQLALAESLKKEPILISQLVRMALVAISYSSVEYILNQTTLNDEQLAGLQQQLSQAYQDNPMVMGLIGERCFIISYIGDPQQLGMPATPGGLLRITGIADRNAMVSLKLIGQYADAMKLPGRQRLLRCREITAEVDDLSIFYSLTKIMMPAFEGVIQIDMRVAAEVDCTRVALGIERYRLAKGSLPKELTDLAPQYIDKAPIDPFDGKPLRYKLTEPGYIVYSIGEDGADEGGLEKDKVAQRGDPHDWPIIVEH
ncbi:MAG: hypothetical protein DRP66_00320 [Planctomycetota bacterium]|nr:MAG: hypothetical protein DRP66_00320 [Planctomycetota bacterium]